MKKLKITFDHDSSSAVGMSDRLLYKVPRSFMSNIDISKITLYPE